MDERDVFTVKIFTDNDAFMNGAPREELARILRNIADRLVCGELPHVSSPGRVMDYNGNECGTFYMWQEAEPGSEEWRALHHAR